MYLCPPNNKNDPSFHGHSDDPRRPHGPLGKWMDSILSGVSVYVCFDEFGALLL